MSRKTKWLRGILAVLILLTAASCYGAWRIASFATDSPSGNFGCAIVLGAAVKGTEPSPVFEGRLEHAAELFRQGRVKRIILTGGKGKAAEISESECGQAYLAGKGVPMDRILIETRSHTTRENLVEAKRLMQEQSLASALVVSDPLHLSRAMTMAHDLKIEAQPSGTPTTRYQNWSSKAPFLAREVFFSALYRVLGK